VSFYYFFYIDILKDMANALFVLSITTKNSYYLRLLIIFMVVYKIVEKHFNLVKGHSSKEGSGLYDLVDFYLKLFKIESNV
jgi:hypothetical protein